MVNYHIIFFVVNSQIIIIRTKSFKITESQNTTKVSNVRSNVDTRVNEISSSQTRIIENKLSTAEMNREKEIQKKIENIRKHVGWTFSFIPIVFFFIEFLFKLIHHWF